MQQAPVTKPHEQDDDNDEIDLMGLLGTLIDHKWLIAGVTGVFMAAGVAYALLATPVYQANALIQVEAKKNDPLGFSDISSMLGKESPSATEIELIKSRRNIGAAVDNLKLDIEVEPNRFPLIGEFMARRFKPDAENAVASPLFGMNSYAWGGEKLKIAELELPQELLGKELTLISYDTIPPPPANTAGPCSETYVAGRSVQRMQAKAGSRYGPQPAAAMLPTAFL